MENSKSKQDSKIEISFRPITDGLGFHPFSDGLPYAPISKGVRSGPSQSSSQDTRLAIPQAIQKPIRTSSVERIQSPIFSTLPNHQDQRNFGLRSQVDSGARLEAKAEILELAYGKAYLLRRLLAYFIDFSFNSILAAVCFGAFAIKYEFSLGLLFDPNILIFGILSIGFVNWIMMALQEVVFKNTIGKKVFGLTLQGSRSQCLLRAIFFLPSVGLFGVGLFVGLFDPKKRCWHDQQAQLQPSMTGKV